MSKEWCEGQTRCQCSPDMMGSPGPGSEPQLGVPKFQVPCGVSAAFSKARSDVAVCLQVWFRCLKCRRQMNFTATHRNESLSVQQGRGGVQLPQRENNTLLGTYPGESRYSPAAILHGFMEQSHGESSTLIALGNTELLDR